MRSPATLPINLMAAGSKPTCTVTVHPLRSSESAPALHNGRGRAPVGKFLWQHFVPNEFLRQHGRTKLEWRHMFLITWNVSSGCAQYWTFRNVCVDQTTALSGGKTAARQCGCGCILLSEATSATPANQPQFLALKSIGRFERSRRTTHCICQSRDLCSQGYGKKRTASHAPTAGNVKRRM
jgi:hypothetical protein